MSGISGSFKPFARALLLLIACATMWLADTAPATAALDDDHQILVTSCAPSGTPAQMYGFDWFSSIPMRDCPNPGLRLGLGVVAYEGHSMVWQYTNYAKVRDIVMDVRDGEWDNGMEYSLATCSDDSCTPLSVLSPDNGGEWTVTGIDSNEIWLRATCRQTTCTPVDPPMPGTESDPIWNSNPSFLKVSSIRLIFEDSAPPIGEFSVDWPAGFGTSVWVRPELLVAPFGLTDAISGIASAGMIIHSEGQPVESGKTMWEVNRNCWKQDGYAYEIPQLCPAGAGPEAGLLDLRGFADGRYVAYAGAIDAVGNRMEPLRQNFGIDGTPPAGLTGLRAESRPDAALPEPINEFGWTDQPVIRLVWDNPRLRPPDAGSPISGTHADVAPLAGTTGAPPQPLTFYDDGSGPISFMSEGRWRFGAWVSDVAGNNGDKEHIALGYDTDQPEPVQPNPIPWVSADRLKDGIVVDWPASPVLPHLESGVCGYAVDVSDDPGHVPDERFDVRSPATSYRLQGTFADGPHHFALRTVSCAGVGSDPVDTPLNVDSVAPLASLAGAPAHGWSRDELDLTVSATDDRAGVTEVFHSTGGARVTTPGSQAGLSLGDGVHTLEIGAKDRAGNESIAQAHVVRVDSTPPRAIFEPRDPETPARIEATVSDETSGIESAWLEVRPSGGAEVDWRMLPTTATAAGAAGQHLGADLPDSLSDGPYELRVIAVDHAGNATDARNVRLSDAPMTVTMPVRQRVGLTAEIAPVTLIEGSRRDRRCKRRQISRRPKSCASRRRIDRRAAGELMSIKQPGRAALVGELSTRSGKPIAGAELEVRETIRGGGPEQLKTIATDAKGRYTLRLPPGPGRNFVVSFPGSPALASKRRTARLRVPTGIALRLSPQRARGGEPVVFSGEVAGAKWQPEGGVRVELQYYNGVKWSPVAGADNADDRGRFAIDDWAPGSVTSPTEYHLRAHVERAFGWPYETGNSQPVTLTVLP